ncbi:VOC family protein [Lentzea rhizosphaerae]|uniref:VOC family protein n=1 Tax=Lentzea rhizosphaerae TaxID=2041025 RepID=A0ABV8BJ88_9PSEU
MCDDLDAVLTTLAAAGVETTRPVTEARWGRLTAVRMPSGAELPLYQPLHPVAHSL